MNNHKVPAPAPAVWPSVGRRKPERSESDRSATGGQTGPDLKAHPDPEVVAQAKRRRFTAEYKHRIVSEAERAKGSGGIGALLRREGLYSSTLTAWRREREAVIGQALTPQKRGPKSKRDPVQEELQKLQKENARLTEELRKAAIVIDVQKKVGALLGWPIATPDPDEKL
jgi:transposase-like protein